MTHKKIDYSKQPITDVPDHILDMVPAEAERYFTKDPDRLLGGYSDEAKDVIRKISTHTKTRSPERRALHKEIILKILGGRTGTPEGVKPPFLLFAGPAGAGKSALRAQFEKGKPLGDEHLNEAQRIYRDNIDSCIYIDFKIFKDSIPEYKAANTAYRTKFGDMYAVVRSEISGLNQAVRQFAKEANLGKVQEQIFDVDLRTSGELDGDAKQYDMTLFAVTCDPETIRERVQARPEPMQDKEVVRAVREFSKDYAFGYLNEISARTFLVDTNGKHKTVLAAKNGKTTFERPEEFQQFNDLTSYEPKAELGKSKSI